MDSPFFTDATSILLTLIVIGIGYISLFLGYFIAKRQKEFLNETTIKSTDKIIISFLIGGFTYLILCSSFSELIGRNIEMIEDTSLIAPLLITILIFIACFTLIIFFFIRKSELKPTIKGEKQK